MKHKDLKNKQKKKTVLVDWPVKVQCTFSLVVYWQPIPVPLVRLFSCHYYFSMTIWKYLCVLGLRLCAAVLLNKSKRRALCSQWGMVFTWRDRERWQTRPVRRSSAPLSLSHSLSLLCTDVSHYCASCSTAVTGPLHQTMTPWSLCGSWRGGVRAVESCSFISLWTSWEAHKSLGLSPRTRGC